MIMSKKIYWMIVFSLITFGCAGTTKIPEPESSEARLYTEKCTQCHSLPHPKRFRSHEWPHFVKLMEVPMKERGVTMTTEDKKIILDYLQNHAR